MDQKQVLVQTLVEEWGYWLVVLVWGQG